MGNDEYRIDSHKLHYHVGRVADWLEGKNVYPIYLEVSPSGMCNHRCRFCGKDFMGYQKRFLPTEQLKKRLTEMGRLGVKSIMYAGEGEPFLHKDMPELISYTAESGIDVAVVSNGVLMKPAITEKILEHTKWIKISCNAGTPETYAKIHRTKPQDFDAVFKNMEHAVSVKRERGYKCTLGLQILLLPENENELEALAEKVRDTGMDYLVIKPYSQHPQSETTAYKDIMYDKYYSLAEKLEKYSTDEYSVIFRVHTMKKWDSKERAFKKCLALPFWAYVDAGGNIWACNNHLNEDGFLYGNILDTSFEEVWNGQKRGQVLNFVDKQYNAVQCRVNCRMDEVNRYLWELTNPNDHVNFI